jgi:hypothetical protein
MQTHTTHNMSKEELTKRLKRGEDIQIVNVLSPEYYNLGFIKGSKRIPRMW